MKSIVNDSVYICLLNKYNGCTKPSYSALGQELGLTRQTVSKKMSYLESQGIISIENNILYVKDLMENDKLSMNDYDILTHIILDDEKNTIKASFIYGIVQNNKIVYVGSTDNFEERRNQHLNKKPFLKLNDIILLTKTSKKNRFQIERLLIKLLNPEWNIMSKED